MLGVLHFGAAIRLVSDSDKILDPTVLPEAIPHCAIPQMDQHCYCVCCSVASRK